MPRVLVVPDKLKGSLTAVDVAPLTGLDPRLREVAIVVACDVDNPLTGQ